MKHGVDVAQPRPGPGTGTTRRSGPTRAAGDRVGQQADPVELDDHRRVADEVEGERPGQRQPLRAASG